MSPSGSPSLLNLPLSPLPLIRTASPTQVRGRDTKGCQQGGAGKAGERWRGLKLTGEGRITSFLCSHQSRDSSQVQVQAPWKP
ncbi:hypothetical protein Cadr_000023266 [Camelus dromedarius]|uniref:Uncharacterized protein n=1 Tax=Camelus dromedarius TaxID=9838 RepID=A0A5N4CI77_CAMDR|nr:hypothetical protein Cadr_000023266 [Camelus dromedarius]